MKMTEDLRRRDQDGPSRRPSSGAARGRGLAAAVVGFLLATAPGASGATTTCGPNQTIANQTINGNVLVPANTLPARSREGCNLVNVTVNGVVTVAPGGELDADTGDGFSVIRGGILAKQAFEIDLFHLTVYGPTILNGAGSNSSLDNSVFRGPVTIENTPANRADYIDVTDSTITGSVLLLNNATRVQATGNQIRGNLMVNGNTGGTRPPGISNNTISGVLSCSRNGTPFTGSNNTAVAKLGQCAGF